MQVMRATHWLEHTRISGKFGAIGRVTGVTVHLVGPREKARGKIYSRRLGFSLSTWPN